MTIQQVIDLVIREFPADEDPATVDTIKIGDPDQLVTGVVSTFMATSPVIAEAARLGANLVVTHEPTFYNHRDEVDWLARDDVYRAKVKQIEAHSIVVWRLHDHLHRDVRDDLTRGVLQALGWDAYADPEDHYRCMIPETTLGELAAFLGDRLGSSSVRIVGEPGMPCVGVGVLMGAWGGRRQIEMLSRRDVDVLVCGEASEWETPEYARDANALGIRKGLVVVGHAHSEEPGMKWFAEWLRSRLPEIEVAHVPAGDPFGYV